MQVPPREGLIRGIRRWDLVALVLNGVIGAGIFGLPAAIYAGVGVYSLPAYLVCAVLIVLIVLCFAEVGSRFSETGGPYLYVREAFGPVVGFEVGWLVWVARITAFGALANLFVTYLAVFWPGAADPTWRMVVIVTLVAASTVINLLGVRNTAVVINVFTVAKLIPLLLLVAVGLCFLEPARFEVGPTPSFASFSAAVLLAVFAFSGFESAVIPGGETQDSARNLPFALLTGIGIVVLLYVLIQVVAIGTVPGLAASKSPLAHAGAQVFGSWGTTLITVGALVSIAGTLNAIGLVAPRVLFALSEQRQLPRLVSATHPRFRSPYVAILFSSAAMLAITVESTFVSALTISTIIRLITYAATCAALPVLRRRADAPPAGFTVRGGTAVAIAALILCAWLLSTVKWHDARLTAIVAGVGMVLFLVHALVSRARSR